MREKITNTIIYSFFSLFLLLVIESCFYFGSKEYETSYKQLEIQNIESPTNNITISLYAFSNGINSIIIPEQIPESMTETYINNEEAETIQEETASDKNINEEAIKNTETINSNVEENPNIDYDKNTDIEDTAIKPYNGNLINNGVNDADMWDCQWFFEQIPLILREKYNVLGWKLFVEGEELANKFGYSFRISGITRSKDKSIWVGNGSNDHQAICHEMGHFLDYINRWCTDEENFVQIYKNELPTFISIWSTHSNNYSTPAEYFAESFEVYCLDNDLLKSSCPQTYNYLYTKLNNIKL